MPKGKNKHLTIEDRIRIEKGIDDGESFASIARAIGVSTSTVSREVRNNRTLYTHRKRANNCRWRGDCRAFGLCRDDCARECKRCGKVDCTTLCPEYDEVVCRDLEHAPFVCASCTRVFNCGFRRARYKAMEAQLSYERRLVSTREGISVDPHELQNMVKVVKALLGKGQSFEAICASGNPAIVVSPRTLYRYAEAGIFGIANIDLPKKVVYKTRRTKRAIANNPIDRTGRTYADFMGLPEDVRSRAVQMDTVMGVRGDFKCILTLHFPPMEFQVYVLLYDHTQACVREAFDYLEHLLGDAFRDVFGTILTDRGVEFADFESLERSCLHPGRRRSRIYYCDALCSHQKASCEKNHVELRKIIPKRTSLEALTNADMAVVASHVNSYPRRSLGGLAPIELATEVLPKDLLDGLGIKRIPPQDVVLKPYLIK